MQALPHYMALPHELTVELTLTTPDSKIHTSIASSSSRAFSQCSLFSHVLIAAPTPIRSKRAAAKEIASNNIIALSHLFPFWHALITTLHNAGLRKLKSTTAFSH
eukprot:gnl/MRDRNA2_/MRDRNA2_349635_c0_seq1.p1 gnl/MRDRNA2_/MRDRNA2_349635_c0~~gnl/MRDRNA2_/MRDRNA2_349635_c0_seq1.p1  ORF type:complete len:105 (-),score=10.79 gnl/MRDRNA2_/MRDRNA2_349635_c0_seq1:207-521(-)